MAYYTVDNPTRVNRRFATAVFAIKAANKVSKKTIAERIGVFAFTMDNWINNRTAMSVKHFDSVVDNLPVPESYYIMEDDAEAQHLLTGLNLELTPIAPLAEEEPTPEEPEAPVWYAEFPSSEALVRYMVSRHDETMYPLLNDDDIQDYIKWCLERSIPVIIKPGN